MVFRGIPSVALKALTMSRTPQIGHGRRGGTKRLARGQCAACLSVRI